MLEACDLEQSMTDQRSRSTIAAGFKRVLLLAFNYGQHHASGTYILDVVFQHSRYCHGVLCVLFGNDC